MEKTFYTIQEVLAVASIHPFYSDHVVYPPNPKELEASIKEATQLNRDLQEFPLCEKRDL